MAKVKPAVKNELLTSVAACMCYPKHCDGCKYNNLDYCKNALIEDLRASMNTDENELSVHNDVRDNNNMKGDFKMETLHYFKFTLNWTLDTREYPDMEHAERFVFMINEPDLMTCFEKAVEQVRDYVKWRVAYLNKGCSDDRYVFVSTDDMLRMYILDVFNRTQYCEVIHFDVITETQFEAYTDNRKENEIYHVKPEYVY